MSRRTAASPIFSQDILLHRLIEGQVRNHTLQPHVLGSRLRPRQRGSAIRILRQISSIVVPLSACLKANAINPSSRSA